MMEIIVTRLGEWRTRRRQDELLRSKRAVDLAAQSALESDDPDGLAGCISAYGRIAASAAAQGFVDIARIAGEAETKTCYELGSTHTDPSALRRCIDGVERRLACNQAALNADDLAGAFRLLGHCHAELGHLNQDPEAFRAAIRAYEASLKPVQREAQAAVIRLTEQNIRLCKAAITSP